GRFRKHRAINDETNRLASTPLVPLTAEANIERGQHAYIIDALFILGSSKITFLMDSHRINNNNSVNIENKIMIFGSFQIFNKNPTAYKNSGPSRNGKSTDSPGTCPALTSVAQS